MLHQRRVYSSEWFAPLRGAGDQLRTTTAGKDKPRSKPHHTLLLLSITNSFCYSLHSVQVINTFCNQTTTASRSRAHFLTTYQSDHRIDAVLEDANRICHQRQLPGHGHHS
jgi:hypothetical protein